MVKEKMDEWKIDIVKTPLTVEGQICAAGKVVMDKSGRQFDADCNPNEFDRNIQAKMFSQKALGERWCIMHTRNTAREANQFMSTIKQCLDQFNFEAGKPAMFELKGNDRQASSWEDLIKEKINN